MKDKKVWTPQGEMSIKQLYDSGKSINGLGQKDEALIDTNTADATLITDGKRGVDDQLVNADDQVFIPAHKWGIADAIRPHLEHMDALTKNSQKILANASKSSLAKNTFNVQKQEMKKYLDKYITPAQNLQSALRASEEETDQDIVIADKGKLPKFDRGMDFWYGRNYTPTKKDKSTTDQPASTMSPFARLFPTVAGVGAGLAQLAHWTANPIRYHSTYAQNPYGTRALTELNQLRYNPYPEIQASQDAERRAAYANSQAGGMTGGQRYLGRIGLGIGGMRNAANVFANAQQQNNNYRTQYANALLQEGNSIASRRQNANQHDWSDYVAAHGAKTRGIEQATANILGQINSGFQNEFKYRTWQDTLDMYRDQQKLDRDRLQADIANRQATGTVNQTPQYGILPWYMMQSNPNLWFNYRGVV